MQEVSVVRGLSCSEPPPQGLETLTGGCYRLAWLHGLAQVVQAGNQEKIKHYMECAARCPVRFEFLPDAASITIKKLQLDQDLKMRVEAEGLYGYKMVRVFAKVQQQLADASLPSTYGDVFHHLQKVKWSERERPRQGAVAMHLKINGRLTPQSIEALDIMEGHFGRYHALAQISALDVVASKTAARDPNAQSRLGVFAVG